MKRGVGPSSGGSEVCVTPVLSPACTVNEIHSLIPSHTSIIIMIFMSVFICIVCAIVIEQVYMCVCVCVLCVYNVLTLWSVNLSILCVCYV